MNAVETHNLTKIHGGRPVVDKLEMHVPRGCMYGFVGRNGAGKSTTMKMIAGLAGFSGGEVVLFGDREPAVPGRIGALIENPGLLPNLSAFGNLMAVALAMGVVGAKEQCAELLHVVGLDDVGKKKVEGFSLGMKQRLGIALALVGTPDVLLLDEPINGLDPEGARAMCQTLVRLNHVRGITIIISSHMLDQLNRMVDRFGVIANGSMVLEFTDDELQKACNDSVRVKTADSSRTLAVLEQALPEETFRVDPDGSVVVSGFRGPARIEDVARVLHDADQTILELSAVGRDVEDYFIGLMNGENHHA